MTMAGISADDFGDDEASAFKTSVAGVLDGVEEEHISNIVATDSSRRRLHRRQLASAGCTVSYDIQISLAETSFSSVDDFHSDLTSQITASVSSGEFASTLIATAGSSSSLATVSVSGVATTLATRPPSAAPTAAPDNGASGGVGGGDGGGGGGDDGGTTIIAVVVVLVVVVAAAVAYFLYKKKGKTGAGGKADVQQQQTFELVPILDEPTVRKTTTTMTTTTMTTTTVEEEGMGTQQSDRCATVPEAVSDEAVEIVEAPGKSQPATFDF